MDTVIVLPGQPITKKNSQQIIRLPNGKRRIKPSKAFLAYEKECLVALYGYQGHKFTEACCIRAVYYLKDARRPDINNLQAATADILQKAGIISDDKLVEHWDGSRRVIQSANPRVDIYIRSIEAPLFSEGD